MHDLTMTRGARWAATGLLILTLVVGGGNLWATYDQVGSVRAAEAASARSAASIVQLCQAGNVARAQQLQLWEHLVAIAVPPPHETRGQMRRRLATTQAFLVYVGKVFAPRNCAGRYG